MIKIRLTRFFILKLMEQLLIHGIRMLIIRHGEKINFM
jgi:hypothetical protein